MSFSKTAASSDEASARRLFIPGPTWVDSPARMAMCGDMMGHRSPEFISLYDSSQPVLKRLAGTDRPVYLAGCSSWGMMEAALRNLVRPGGRVLNCCCGAFSDKWHDVSLRCGFKADALNVEWGAAVNPALLRDFLKRERYDLVTLVHAETSTGVLNPLQELASVVNEFDDVLLAVDAVSSYSAVRLEMDAWGVDVLLSGTQKALALPPGMALCAVSDRGLARAGEVPDRGFYFDFLEYEKNAREGMTISTPCIPLVMGLDWRTREIKEEGIQERFERHSRCREYIEFHAVANGWKPLPAEGNRANTLNCLFPPSQADTSVFTGELKSRSGFIIDAGYGRLRGKCIRISNMGMTAPEHADPLLHAMGWNPA